MFKGANFIFNEIPSEKFGLKIGFLSESAVKNTYSGLKLSIEEEKIKRVDQPVFFGIEKTGKISFEILVYSEVEVDTYDRQVIDRWLFQNEYKYFKIEQPDYNGLFFRCIMTEATKVEIGETPYMKKIIVTCDSPYVYTDEYIYNSISTSTPSNINITNLSNINGYSYPEFIITTTTSGSVSIKNNTDSRTFLLNGLDNAETITVDNDKKIILSDSGLRRMSNFNKNWFRLLPDINNLTLTGNFNLAIKIRYRLTI